MTKEQLEDLKNQIKEFGRKKLAKKTGILYPTLSGKLNEFGSFTKDDLKKINEILNG